MRTYSLGLGLVALLGCCSGQAAAASVTSPCSVKIDQDAQLRDRLTILGTPAKQNISVTVNTNGSVLVRVDCNGDGDFTDALDLPATLYTPPTSSFYTLDVQGKGADSVVLALAAGTFSGLALNPHVTLGPGQNSVGLGNDGAELTSGSHVMLDVVGGAGNDWVEILQPALDASTVSLNASLGAGNDVVVATLAGNAVNGTFDVDVDLGAGKNTFYTGRAGAGVSAPPVFRVNVVGGSGVDEVATQLTGAYPEDFTLTADLGLGNDLFRMGVDLADLNISRTVALDINAGDGANQFLIGRGTTRYMAGQVVPGCLELRLKGGAGIDKLGVDFGEGGLDLDGTGTFRLRADLGAGNDVLTSFMEVSEVPAAPDGTTVDISLTGGAGNDRIWQLFNNYGPNLPTNFNPFGSVMIDGGSGLDTCVTGGTGLSHVRGCEL